MNPGPISRGHAAIANDCAACHPQGEHDPRRLPSGGPKIARAEYFVPIDQGLRRTVISTLRRSTNRMSPPT